MGQNFLKSLTHKLYQQGVAVSQRINAYKYLECSAKDGNGVREVFEHATRAALMVSKSKKKKGCNLL
jgi:Ras homolog gene family, member A